MRLTLRRVRVTQTVRLLCTATLKSLMLSANDPGCVKA